MISFARIYGYKDSAELFREIKQPGYEGPYDDEHEDFLQSIEGQEFHNMRRTHINSVLASELPDFSIQYTDPAKLLIDFLALFSSAKIQKKAYEELRRSGLW